MSGPLAIAIAAVLWATDSLFRKPAVDHLDATLLVFLEHLLGVVILYPIARWKEGAQLRRLNGATLAQLVLIGVGGSALATVFFTASFRYLNPSVAILLQKLQPIIVVLTAWVFLKEKPGRGFFLWGTVALLAAIGLSFPDLQFDFLRDGVDLRTRGVLYAVSASALWAFSTVAGRSLLRKHAPWSVTYWRFAFGLGALGLLLILAWTPIPWDLLSQPRTWVGIGYMSFLPGIVAMAIYYQGLRHTPASKATFIELIFPVGAVILNTLFLNSPLVPTQLFAGAILIFAITRIGF